MRDVAFLKVEPASDPSRHSGWERLAAALPGARILGIAVAGLGLGLFATAVVLHQGWDPGAVAIGPWVARPQVGTPAIDPYARAGLALTGEVPLAANEGLAFTAETDSTGFRLIRTCTYRLSGTVPAARFWTLSAVDVAGRRMDDPADRSAFTSTTVIRDMTGAFTIEIGPRARPGNWIPTSGGGPMNLVLRLYDTPLTATPRTIAASALPAIARQSCAAP